MTGENPIVKILIELVNILNAYENKNELFSNQGQPLDGYSALANFLSVANKAKNLLENLKNQEDLDADFKQILFDNLWNLYEEEEN